jgi:hypothetical protein
MATTVPVPNHVVRVIEEFRTVELAALRRSRRPMPSRLSPIVISVVKNEFDRLAEFLCHYRSLGIERFAFIDNGSTDGTLEYLAAQPDVDLYARTGSFDWMLKQGWVSRVIDGYGYDRWYVYADADEHIVFDGCPAMAFPDLTDRMEILGLRRVRGFLIDMYADGRLIDGHYDAGKPLLDAFPWFDRDSYTEARYPEIISVKGGPRRRVFGPADARFNPEMTKYPLFKTSPGEFMVNPHHLWPWDENFLSPRFLGILHFKFLPGILDRIRDAIARKNYWDDSFEYRCYLSIMEAKPDISLWNEHSERFEGAAQLVENGMIAAIDWGARSTSVDVMRTAYRRQRERHLAGAGAGLCG